ncbi:nucleoside triphosphate pyrophosphohydrolase [Rhodococcus sp. ABRD24]|uniref:MazG family protein n=1 Tax=Rhodococcus sp. ABRD24 TaxID=2507582 RepID=UPI00103DD4E0|nr:MazG family protein [Rhodococcus sp. ABRD24]QBJ97630.1 nucleoside triphosphate pyrophosphohydrolase [Rhodococcus sp. ABRD24]
MTVVLLDPLRPTTVPLEAVPLLAGGIEITDCVPESARMLLPDPVPGAPVLISTDPTHPAVQVRIAAGERVITSPRVAGENLVEAAEVMDRLWGYGGWEVTQTHESLAHYLVEETYEVLDAIASANPDDLREELGDLLLQVLFHSRIANAAGRFDVDDVAGALVAKLVHRSPHLSEDAVGPIDIAEQERAWEVRKGAEKARGSCVDGIAASQPATSLAAKVIQRAGKAGFPAELVPAELVLGAQQVTRAEDELRTATNTFTARVRSVEAAARADGVMQLTASDWIRYWSRA